MRFKIGRKDLLEQLQILQGTIERRLPQPILSNLLLTVKDNTLSITAINLEIELVTWTIVEDVSEEGRTTVSGRKLIDITRLSPENTPIDIALKDDRLLIQFGRSRYNLSTLPAHDFPTTTAITNQQSIRCSQSVLKQLIHLTQFSIASETARAMLMGALIEINPGKIKVVATDGHRLAMATHTMQCDVSEQCQIIMPRKPVATLNRLFDDGKKTITIDIGSNVVRFTFDNAILTSKLIDGTFPDYEVAIPDANECNRRITANRDDLRTAFLRLSIFGDTNRSLGLSLAEKDTTLLSLSTEDIQEGNAREELDVIYSGTPMQAKFNVTYLIDIFNVLDQENVHLMFSDKGCLIRPQGSAECLFVVMPISET